MLGARDGNVKPLHILDEANVGAASAHRTEDDKVAFLSLKRIDSGHADVWQCRLDGFDLRSEGATGQGWHRVMKKSTKHLYGVKTTKLLIFKSL
jgi:hypothetical protein